MASVTVQLSTAVTGHKTLEDVLWVADLLHRFDFSQRAHTHTLYMCTDSWEITAFLQTELSLFYLRILFIWSRKAETHVLVCARQRARSLVIVTCVCGPLTQHPSHQRRLSACFYSPITQRLDNSPICFLSERSRYTQQTLPITGAGCSDFPLTSCCRR